MPSDVIGAGRREEYRRKEQCTTSSQGKKLDDGLRPEKPLRHAGLPDQPEAGRQLTTARRTAP